MTDTLAFLLNLLEDEFRSEEGLRVRPVFRSGERRSPDLPQDYDPGSSSVHLRSGVLVQTGRKEFFFPEGWLREPSHDRIKAQIREIRELLGRWD